jgi:sulfate adenylyltransferase
MEAGSKFGELMQTPTLRADQVDTSNLIAPHGGTLINRIASEDERQVLRDRARQLPAFPLDSRAIADVECIATGVYSPLTGFLGEADYRRVVDEMRLANGLPWSIPVTFSVTEEQAGSLSTGDEIALTFAGDPVAVMTVEEIYRRDKQHEAQQVFRTTEEAHPGVEALYTSGDVVLGGPITVIEPIQHEDFVERRFTPEQTRAEFASRGWKTIVAFQTRNPIHRAHEYLQKVALEIVDGLFVNPLVGTTKGDDVPADVRMQTYEVILGAYYPQQRTILGVFPAAMRYAGPREAIMHALARKNYGCTHFIVGRDHAGVGSYYGTYDAQLIFDEFEPGELGITPLKFEHGHFCRDCGQLVTSKTCPHGQESWVTLSGTRVRQMLTAGEMPPPEFTRPEVARILIEAYRERAAD